MVDNIYYCIVLIILNNIPQYIFINFPGQQHLALLRLHIGSSGTGDLAGGVLVAV